jgi:uncharacterized protein with FMN-binding domain
MKKFLISAFFVVSFGAYATYNFFTSTTNAQQTSSSNSGATPVIITNTPSGSAPPTNTTPTPVTTVPATVKTTPTKTVTSTPTPTPVVTVPKVPTGQYVNGTYTGSVADAYYGNIQVEAVISGGKLTNVIFLQSPGDRSTSRYINQQAMPQLKAEAIQAQSANVDGVSGASDSSAAFKESLASALSQAKA